MLGTIAAMLVSAIVASAITYWLSHRGQRAQRRKERTRALPFRWKSQSIWELKREVLDADRLGFTPPSGSRTRRPLADLMNETAQAVLQGQVHEAQLEKDIRTDFLKLAAIMAASQTLRYLCDPTAYRKWRQDTRGAEEPTELLAADQRIRRQAEEQYKHLRELELRWRD